MYIKEIGVFLLVLVFIVIFGNIWFNFVESILGRIKRIFTRGKEPAWHPFPDDMPGSEIDKNDVE